MRKYLLYIYAGHFSACSSPVLVRKKGYVNQWLNLFHSWTFKQSTSLSHTHAHMHSTVDTKNKASGLMLQNDGPFVTL